MFLLMHKTDGYTYDSSRVKQLRALLTELVHVVKLQLRDLPCERVDVVESRLGT